MVTKELVPLTASSSGIPLYLHTYQTCFMLNKNKIIFQNKKKKKRSTKRIQSNGYHVTRDTVGEHGSIRHALLLTISKMTRRKKDRRESERKNFRQGSKQTPSSGTGICEMNVDLFFCFVVNNLLSMSLMNCFSWHYKKSELRKKQTKQLSCPLPSTLFPSASLPTPLLCYT